jgi:hypothetical protein
MPLETKRVSDRWKGVRWVWRIVVDQTQIATRRKASVTAEAYRGEPVWRRRLAGWAPLRRGR